MSNTPEEYDPVDKFNGPGIHEVEDDPYAELFADCRTPEEVLQLQREIEKAERS